MNAILEYPFPVAAEPIAPSREPAGAFGDSGRGRDVPLRQGRDQLDLDGRQGERAQAVLAERLPCDRAPARDDLLADHGRVGPDLLLRVRVHP